MAEIGRLTAVFDADTRKFDSGVRGVASKITALDSNFKGLTGSASSAIGTISGLAGPLSIAAGAAVVAASAIGSVAVGLSELVKSSAKAGGELQDLAQKTSFTVETLSALSIVAKTTGSDINAISGSLIIFQKNMGAAQDATSTQGKLFKSLSIDTRDNEKALRQAFTTLAKYGDTQKAVELSTKLFGRSGAAVLAIVKETNGNLDQAIKKYTELGLVISGSAAQASDKFNDLLEETTLQLEAVTRSIGMELLPVATDALQSISNSLKANKNEWAAWGTSIANVLRGLSVVVHSEIGQMLGRISEFAVKWLTIPGLVAQGLGALGASVDRPSEDPFGPGGAARGGRSALPGTPEWMAAQRRMLGSMATGGSGGGGGGRGGGGSAARTSAGADLLKQMERELSDVMPKRVMWEKLMGEEYKKTADSIKKKIYVLDFEIEAQKKVNDLTRERLALGAQEREDFQKFVELVQQSLTRKRSAFDITGDNFFDLGSGSVYGAGEGSTRKRRMADGATRQRIATPELQAARDQIARVRDQMRDLGNDLTSVFRDSITAGFNQGVKSGLATLAQGLLQIVQEIFLRRLAAGLGELLGNLATGTGGGGGGFWSGLLKAVIGGAAGGLGGGGSGSAGGAGTAAAGALKGFANGGWLGPGEVGVAGERGPELIFGGRNGLSVLSNKGAAQVVNNYHINMPPDRGGSYNSPKSRRQMARELVMALQGANG